MDTVELLNIRRWNHQYTVLALCIGAYFTVRFVQLTVSAVLPSILDTFGVSRATIGIVLGGMWAVYAFAQLPSGVFSDHFGGRTIVLAALALTSIAALGLAGAPSFVLFSAFILVLGAGAGLYYNAATSLLIQQFEAIGQTIGIHRFGSPGAGLLAPLIGAAIASRYGWRIALGSGVFIALLILTAFAWRVPSATAVQPRATLRSLFGPDHLLNLLSQPSLAYTTVLAMLAEFVGLAIMSFLPTFLVQHHGYTLDRAGLLFSGFYAIYGVSQPLTGWLSDRVGRDTVFGLAMCAGVIGYGTLSLTTSLVPTIFAIGLAGYEMSWPATLQSRAIDILGESEQGVGFGLFRTIYLLSGALGTTLVGRVADTAGWGISFQAIAAVLTVALFSLIANQALGLRL